MNPGQGGGLCVGVSRELPLAMLREGGDEVKCINVQVEVGQQILVVHDVWLRAPALRQPGQEGAVLGEGGPGGGQGGVDAHH